MNLVVRPVEALCGSIVLPASKSYSIRAFMIAACGGSSQLINPSNCDDALVAQRMAQALGAKVTARGKRNFAIRAHASQVRLKRLNVKESGTVLRFLLPLLALEERRATVFGEGSLKGRPNTFLIEALRKQGVQIEGTGPNQSVPIYLRGGRLQGGEIRIDGSLSSQFISALLIACPQLPQNTRLTIIGKSLVSETYITMTRQILARAGVKVMLRDKKHILIPGGQIFGGLKNYVVPSDYGLAAFFMVAAALLDSRVTLGGSLQDNAVQADGAILGFLRSMGMRWKKTSRSLVLCGPFNLRGGDFSLKDCPDLVPIMAVAAMFAKGKTRLKDIAHARVKESDRIGDLTRELKKVGARIETQRSSMTIYPQSEYLHHQSLDPHNDHRLAMAFSILGLKLGVKIKDIDCTHKSYPDFVDDMQCLLPPGSCRKIR